MSYRIAREQLVQLLAQCLVKHGSIEAIHQYKERTANADGIDLMATSEFMVTHEISLRPDKDALMEAAKQLAGKILTEHAPAPAITPPLLNPQTGRTQPTATQSRLSVVSLVCGILTFVTCFTGIPAVIFGHAARRRIKKNLDRWKGETMALIGLRLGYGGMLAWGLMAYLGFLAGSRALQVAANTSTHSTLTSVDSALIQYNSQNTESIRQCPAHFSELETYGDRSSLKKNMSRPRLYSGDWLYYPSATSLAGNQSVMISPPVAGTCYVLKVDHSIQKISQQEALALQKTMPQPTRIPSPPL